MSDIAISVENLSKKFRIGTANSPGYHRLSEALTGVPRMAWSAFNRANPLRSLRPASQPTALAAGSSPQSHASSLQPANEFWALKDVSFSASEPTALAAGSSLQSQASSLQPANEFWALKDVSFEVKQGEVVGIIGRNGAGKSTLLKILSRISEPTSGRFGIRGRVASLLEVGTGFHPELTGRENIFVSGVTLGMTRAEIKKRFDEIVDFSGVEKFLDTPVKHYSSGMQVRLGFAVASHLSCEILIVDEVLAVGDAEFQKKCVRRMRDVTQRQQTTVLMVSHNSEMLETLCSTAMMINGGAIFATGPCNQVMQIYREERLSAKPIPLAEQGIRQGNGLARFLNVSLSSNGRTNVDYAQCGDQISLLLEIRLLESADVEISIGINDELDRRIAHVSTNLFKTGALGLETGVHTIAIDFPRLALAPGVYSTTLFMVADGQIADWVKDGAVMRVSQGPFFQSGRLPPDGQGSFLLDHSFRVLNQSNEATRDVKSKSSF